MRLPFAPGAPPADDPEVAAIYTRIAARRSPRPLTPLDLALLHSPHIADGWNSFIGAIRMKSSLDAKLRELAICRVAVLNKASYEWMHHAPLAKKEGVSEEGMKVLADRDVRKNGAGLSEKQWVLLKYVDSMTNNVEVDNEVFAELLRHFNNQEVVEITATVAAYNGVSRFLVALDVGEMNGKSIVVEGILEHPKA